jgi:hypothetical protein
MFTTGLDETVKPHRLARRSSYSDPTKFPSHRISSAARQKMRKNRRTFAPAERIVEGIKIRFGP